MHRTPVDTTDMHPNEALFANEAFYVAFARKDVAAMEQIWSSRSTIVCVHPGWAALSGRAAVLGSWRAILTNPGQPTVSFYGATCRELAPGTFAVICYEVVAGGTMVAINVFANENGVVKLVSHQAGPCSNPPPIEDQDQLRIN